MQPKVRLYEKGTDNFIDVWPIDANEILATGGYTRTPSGGEKEEAEAAGEAPGVGKLVISGISARGTAFLESRGFATAEDVAAANWEDLHPSLKVSGSGFPEGDIAALETWHRLSNSRATAAALAKGEKPRAGRR